MMQIKFFAQFSRFPSLYALERPMEIH